MKYLAFLLILVPNIAFSELPFVKPPMGLIPFWSFSAETELEEKAFTAAKVYLKNKDEDLNNYYLAEKSLNVATGLFSFYIVHITTYNDSRKVMDQSYKNGEIFFDIRENKIVKFQRK